MKKYSKCAIYKLNKFSTKEGSTFYDAILTENTYNPKIPYTNKWETTFYNCQIYCDIELEVANFDLGVSKNNLSFENISNPAHSIIRILDFEYVNRTCWKGKTQVKTDMGKPIYKQYIAITKCEYDYPQYQTEERKTKLYENKIEHFKEVNKKLHSEITKLKKEILKRDEELLEKNERLNNIEIAYNPKFKEKKVLPTKSDMVAFEDI